MPPRQKTSEASVALAAPLPENPYHPKVGDFVNVVIGGQSRHKGAEVLEFHGDGIVIRSDLNGLTRAEVSYIPWSAIEGLGLIGKR